MNMFCIYVCVVLFIVLKNCVKEGLMLFMMLLLDILKIIVLKKWIYLGEMFLMKFIFIFNVILMSIFFRMWKVWKNGVVNNGKIKRKGYVNFIRKVIVLNFR